MPGRKRKVDNPPSEDGCHIIDQLVPTGVQEANQVVVLSLGDSLASMAWAALLSYISPPWDLN